MTAKLVAIVAGLALAHGAGKIDHHHHHKHVAIGSDTCTLIPVPPRQGHGPTTYVSQCTYNPNVPPVGIPVQDVPPST